MSGYIIAQINVKNIENYQEYLKKVTTIAKKYGGEYIVRAGNFEIMEGVWPFKRNVIIMVNFFYSSGGGVLSLCHLWML